jgi:hypothetical protein
MNPTLLADPPVIPGRIFTDTAAGNGSSSRSAISIGANGVETLWKTPRNR